MTPAPGGHISQRLHEARLKRARAILAEVREQPYSTRYGAATIAWALRVTGDKR